MMACGNSFIAGDPTGTEAATTSTNATTGVGASSAGGGSVGPGGNGGVGGEPGVAGGLVVVGGAGGESPAGTSVSVGGSPPTCLTCMEAIEKQDIVSTDDVCLGTEKAEYIALKSCICANPNGSHNCDTACDGYCNDAESPSSCHGCIDSMDVCTRAHGACDRVSQ